MPRRSIPRTTFLKMNERKLLNFFSVFKGKHDTDDGQKEAKSEMEKKERKMKHLMIFFSPSKCMFNSIGKVFVASWNGQDEEETRWRSRFSSLGITNLRIYALIGRRTISFCGSHNNKKQTQSMKNSRGFWRVNSNLFELKAELGDVKTKIRKVKNSGSS